MSITLGEKAEFIIAQEHVFGMMGSLPTIPGNATLIFTVELI